MPARKSLLKSGKKKPVRVSQETKRQVNKKFWGAEPPPVSDRAWFLSWCANMVEPEEARHWLEEYLSAMGLTAKRVPDRWINQSACFRARLHSLGAPFTEEQESLLTRDCMEMLRHQDEPGEDRAPQPTIADRVRDKFSDVMGDLEGMLDDGLTEGFDVRAWCAQRGISPTIARKIAAKLMRPMEEIDDAIEGRDDQLVEAYRHMSKQELRQLLEVYMNLTEDLLQMIDNEKRTRAPRKPKPVSVEKKLKHMAETYQKFSKEWNIASVDPVKVIGAQELWTLNTKYKLLTVYRAESHGGQLDVARCKVIGFNRNDSHTYRLGRGKRAEEIAREAIKSSKSTMKGLVSGLKEAPLAERVNENTVLLRVL